MATGTRPPAERRRDHARETARAAAPEPATSAPAAPAAAAEEGPVELAIHTAEALWHAIEHALELPAPPPSRWHRAGIGARGERVFDLVAWVVIALFLAGWTWTIAHTERPGHDDAGTSAVSAATAGVAAALSGDGPTAAYATEAIIDLLGSMRGTSGKLRAHIQQPGEELIPDTLAAQTDVRYSSDVAADSSAGGHAPSTPGVWDVAVRAGDALKPLTDFNVITLTPFSTKQGGRIGLYFLGSWPGERGGRVPRPAAAPESRYAPPAGFIQVTRENQTTAVSEHFRLRDFLTKDQFDVWPKYLVLEPRLVDKLELVLAALEARGISTAGVRVLSGFRTPRYNAAGGDPRGRAALSRHMYGDASDIFIDNDGNGAMDDLNHDGRVNIEDARVIEAAVDRVEAEHPELVGGCGVYPATSGHGPFTHVDTRGYRARWIGSNDF